MKGRTDIIIALIAVALVGSQLTPSTPSDEPPAKEVVQSASPQTLSEEGAAGEGEAGPPKEEEPEKAEKRTLYIHGSAKEAEEALKPGQVVVLIHTDPSYCVPCRRLEEEVLGEDMHAWWAAHFSLAILPPDGRNKIPTTKVYLPGKPKYVREGYTNRKTYTNWLRQQHAKLTR